MPSFFAANSLLLTPSARGHGRPRSATSLPSVVRCPAHARSRRIFPDGRRSRPPQQGVPRSGHTRSRCRGVHRCSVVARGCRVPRTAPRAALCPCSLEVRIVRGPFFLTLAALRRAFQVIVFSLVVAALTGCSVHGKDVGLITDGGIRPRRTARTLERSLQ